MRHGRSGLATGRTAAAIILLAGALAIIPSERAVALIMGGTGNAPVRDPGWPKGAAAVFNRPERVAWWEGPPFGGGQWHADCRGDTKTLNAVLADFAKVDVKTKRVIVHDGAGHSFWLDPNRDKAKQKDEAKIDWVFMVWQPASWEQLRTLPSDFNPTDPADAENGLPCTIDVFAGGNVRWAGVTVPAGIEVIDRRLEAHGFSEADGTVLEGKVVDLKTRQPIAARVRLQKVESKNGGYQYPNLTEASADAQGRWVIKKAPAEWLRVVVEADGYVSRVLGHAQLDGQPHWEFYDCGLARPAPVSGRVTDDAGKPLADVEVQFQHVTAGADGRDRQFGRYESSNDYTCKTGPDGRFRAETLPKGKATIWLNKPGYVRPGLGQPITTPAADVELRMGQSSRIRVTVDFAGAERPEGYIVEMEPEGGAAVGKWSGSGNIDAKNTITFEQVPPGPYILYGHPNPSHVGERTKPLAFELKGGQSAEITLTAE